MYLPTYTSDLDFFVVAAVIKYHERRQLKNLF